MLHADTLVLYLRVGRMPYPSNAQDICLTGPSKYERHQTAGAAIWRQMNVL